jgi:hypothetical protein
MTRRLTVWTLLMLPLIATSAESQKTPAAKDPLYSSVHSVVIPEHEPYKKRIVAPDGQSFVSAELVDDPEEGDIQRIRVTVGERSFTLRTKGRGAEILWSPDSRYLAVRTPTVVLDSRHTCMYTKSQGPVCETSKSTGH